MTYLTERQRDVLSYIRRQVLEDGVAPTLQEISDAFSFSSTATAQKHVAQLERKGYLKREKHQKRGLTLSTGQGEQHPEKSHLPLLGVVAAGAPIESYPGDESIDVPEPFVKGPNCYALLVRGESMADEGVLDGDYIVVQERADVSQGDMVVALVENEVTLKRFFRDTPELIRLQPSNATMKPILVPAQSVRIQGIVVGLLRRYSP